jgi:excinuclease ABC subunit A
VIDLGPEGGAGGGRIIAVGTPEEVAQREPSATGRFLADLFVHEQGRPIQSLAG